MTTDGRNNKPHIYLTNPAQSEPFRANSGGGGGASVPRQDRESHGRSLLQQFDQIKPDLERAIGAQREAELDEGFGLQIEFESFPDIALAFESLTAERSQIELLNVQHVGNKTLATVFIPDGKLDVLERKVRDYLNPDKDPTYKDEGSNPRNQKLIDAIQSIRVASIRSLWTDSDDVFPRDLTRKFHTDAKWMYRHRCCEVR